jgi:hypothetical protein
MPSVTHAGTTFNTTAGNKTVTATPALSDLIFVFCGSSGLSGGTSAVSDNNADGNGSYSQVGSNVGITQDTIRLNAWVRNTLIGSATPTVFTATQTSSTGGGLCVLRVAGMSRQGLAAIRNTGSGGGTNGTPSATFLGGQATLTGNTVLAAESTLSGSGGNPAGTPTGFTKDNTINSHSIPTHIWFVGHRNSGHTSSTVTWTSAPGGVWVTLCVELDASAAPADLSFGQIIGLARRVVERTRRTIFVPTPAGYRRRPSGLLQPI